MREACKGTNHKVLGYYHTFRYENNKFVMLHYPMESWEGKQYESIHLHGHLHDKKILIDIPNRYNVCLDNEHKIYLLDDFIKKEIQ